MKKGILFVYVVLWGAIVPVRSQLSALPYEWSDSLFLTQLATLPAEAPSWEKDPIALADWVRKRAEVQVFQYTVGPNFAGLDEEAKYQVLDEANHQYSLAQEIYHRAGQVQGVIHSLRLRILAYLERSERNRGLRAKGIALCQEKLNHLDHLQVRPLPKNKLSVSEKTHALLSLLKKTYIRHIAESLGLGNQVDSSEIARRFQPENWGEAYVFGKLTQIGFQQALLENDPSEALAILSLSDEIFQAHDFPLIQLSTFLQSARYLIASKQASAVEQALENMRVLVADYEELHSLRLTILVISASQELMLGHYAASLRHSRQALAEMSSMAADDPFAIYLVYGLSGIGFNLLEMGLVDESIAVLERGEEQLDLIAEATRHKGWRFQINIARSVLLGHLSQAYLFANRMEESIHLGHQSKDEMYAFLAELDSIFNAGEEALPALMQQLLHNILQPLHGIAIAPLAVGYQHLEEYEDAIALYEQAYPFLDQTSVRDKYLSVLHNLAHCYVAQGANPQKTQAILEKAAAESETYQYTGTLHKIYLLKGRFYLQQQQWKAAQDELNKLIQIADTVGFAYLKAMAGTELAKVYLARRQARKALKVLSQINFDSLRKEKLGYLQARKVQGEAYLMRKQLAQAQAVLQSATDPGATGPGGGCLFPV